MATIPLSGTNIRLLSGVPFSNDYKNTRWFDAEINQLNYFLAKPTVHEISQANFQRIEGHSFISVNKSIDELWGTNYLMFQNASYNNKWFYAFVTRLEYVQRNTTYVHFQIDVLQSWRFNFTFKPSFVVREHCPLWNHDGTPVINTVDEGLNYGTDYEVVAVENYMPYDNIFFLVIVAKQEMHEGIDKGHIVPNVNALPQPLTYYIHPFHLNGTSVSVTIDGVAKELSPVSEVLKAIYTDISAVNNVVSLYVTEHAGANVEMNGTSLNFLNDSSATYTEVAIGIKNTIHVQSVEWYRTKTDTIGSKYESFNPVTESKLLMYPYSITIIDDYKGNRQVIKNEYINDTNLVISAVGSLGTMNKTAYRVNSYLQPSVLYHGSQTALEHALINNSPNDLPIVSDYLSAYLQGNKNTIENQKTSILWNTSMGMIGNAVGGVASGVSGNPLGAMSSAVGVIQGAGSGIIQIQGIEAKLKDIDNMPPNLVKMGSNAQFDYGNGLTGIFIVKKQITKEYRDKLTDFFNMYGYKINEVKVPNFHTRQNWNYVQTISCNITGNFNNEDLQELKNIFDGGITLWHTDDVGNYSLANGVI